MTILILMYRLCIHLVSGCPTGRFGQNCSEFCANRLCLNNHKICHDNTGACDGGCLDGFQGSTCMEGNYVVYLELYFSLGHIFLFPWFVDPQSSLLTFLKFHYIPLTVY